MEYGGTAPSSGLRRRLLKSKENLNVMYGMPWDMEIGVCHMPGGVALSCGFRSLIAPTPITERSVDEETHSRSGYCRACPASQTASSEKRSRPWSSSSPPPRERFLLPAAT